MTDERSIHEAIAALERQRGVLSDASIDTAVRVLRERLPVSNGPTGLQRRLVTVLFADIVGSTAIAHALDAEDALEVLGRAIQT